MSRRPSLESVGSTVSKDSSLAYHPGPAPGHSPVPPGVDDRVAQLRKLSSYQHASYTAARAMMLQTHTWRLPNCLARESHRSERFELCGEPFTLGFWPKGGMVHLPAATPEGDECCALSLRYEGERECVQCHVVLRILSPATADPGASQDGVLDALLGSAPVADGGLEVRRSAGFERFLALRDLTRELLGAGDTVTVEVGVTCLATSLDEARAARGFGLGAGGGSGVGPSNGDGSAGKSQEELDAEEDAAIDRLVAPWLKRSEGRLGARCMLAARLPVSPTTAQLVCHQRQVMAARAQARRKAHALADVHSAALRPAASSRAPCFAPPAPRPETAFGAVLQARACTAAAESVTASLGPPSRAATAATTQKPPRRRVLGYHAGATADGCPVFYRHAHGAVSVALSAAHAGGGVNGGGGGVNGTGCRSPGGGVNGGPSATGDGERASGGGPGPSFTRLSSTEAAAAASTASAASAARASPQGALLAQAALAAPSWAPPPTALALSSDLKKEAEKERAAAARAARAARADAWQKHTAAAAVAVEAAEAAATKGAGGATTFGATAAAHGGDLSGSMRYSWSPAWHAAGKGGDASSGALDQGGVGRSGAAHALASRDYDAGHSSAPLTRVRVVLRSRGGLKADEIITVGYESRPTSPDGEGGTAPPAEGEHAWHSGHPLMISRGMGANAACRRILAHMNAQRPGVRPSSVGTTTFAVRDAATGREVEVDPFSPAPFFAFAVAASSPSRVARSLRSHQLAHEPSGLEEDAWHAEHAAFSSAVGHRDLSRKFGVATLKATLDRAAAPPPPAKDALGALLAEG